MISSWKRARRRMESILALRLVERDRKSTRLNSSHGYISYAVFCLKKKKSVRATGSMRRIVGGVGADAATDGARRFCETIVEEGGRDERAAVTHMSPDAEANGGLRESTQSTAGTAA